MFSENQIKNIVNQGIESGDISGGTKLYKHFITDGVNEINIISTSKEKYTEQLFEVMSNDILLIILYDDANSYSDLAQELVLDGENSTYKTFGTNTSLPLNIGPELDYSIDIL